MKVFYQILGIVLLLLASFYFGRVEGKRSIKLPAPEIEIVEIVDTIRDIIPYPKIEKEIEIVIDTFIVEGKPVEVNIPITQKEYKTELYQAFISGYRQSLDSINIFQKTIYKKETSYIPIPVKHNYRLGLTSELLYLDKRIIPSAGVFGEFRIKNNFITEINLGYSYNEKLQDNKISFSPYGKVSLKYEIFNR